LFQQPHEELRDGFAEDVRRGLTATPKALPPRWFYDGLGSLLFDAITLLPEYYPTRTEQAILDAHLDAMLEACGDGPLAVVELGSGNSAKTRTILRGLLDRQGSLTYCPIDISASALESAAARLREEFPTLRVKPVAARYRAGLATLRGGPMRKVVLFLGSSIGNFTPEEAGSFLADVRSAMDPKDLLLLGTDLDKDPAVLQPAYDDGQGVTAAFNKNVLGRINRELGAAFPLEHFRHVAAWNAAEHRMEMHLEAARAMRVPIPALGLTIALAQGERIHTEHSHKFTPAMLRGMFEAGGFAPQGQWTDPKGWFALHLLGPTP
jgi:L-histidine Nalpha-methyltransferase